MTLPHRDDLRGLDAWIEGEPPDGERDVDRPDPERRPRADVRAALRIARALRRQKGDDHDRPNA